LASGGKSGKLDFLVTFVSSRNEVKAPFYGVERSGNPPIFLAGKKNIIKRPKVSLFVSIPLSQATAKILTG
jgi:hypothetical protein